jgi:hypothetical protein
MSPKYPEDLTMATTAIHLPHLESLPARSLIESTW